MFAAGLTATPCTLSNLATVLLEQSKLIDSRNRNYQMHPEFSGGGMATSNNNGFCTPTNHHQLATPPALNNMFNPLLLQLGVFNAALQQQSPSVDNSTVAQQQNHYLAWLAASQQMQYQLQQQLHQHSMNVNHVTPTPSPQCSTGGNALLVRSCYPLPLYFKFSLIGIVNICTLQNNAFVSCRTRAVVRRRRAAVCEAHCQTRHRPEMQSVPRISNKQRTTITATNCTLTAMQLRTISHSHSITYNN
jgi:hypothetical protein